MSGAQADGHSTDSATLPCCVCVRAHVELPVFVVTHQRGAAVAQQGQLLFFLLHEVTGAMFVVRGSYPTVHFILEKQLLSRDSSLLVQNDEVNNSLSFRKLM